jgi:hypothetical protein
MWKTLWFQTEDGIFRMMEIISQKDNGFMKWEINPTSKN